MTGLDGRLEGIVSSDLAQALPVALFVVAPDGRVVRASPRASTLCMQPPAKLPGRDLATLLPPREPGRWQRLLEEVFSLGAVVDVEVKLAAGRGRPLVVGGTAGPFLGEQDGRRHALLLLRDATRRHRSRQLFESQWQTLTSCAPVDVVDDRLAPLLHLLEDSLAPGAVVALQLTNVDGTDLRRLVAGSLPAPLRRALSEGFPVSSRGPAAARAVHRRRPVTTRSIRRTLSWGPVKEAALGAGLRACLAVPLRGAGDRVTGALTVYFREEGAPGESTRALVLQVARTLAQLVERTRQQRELRQRRRVQHFTQEFNANLGREHVLGPLLKRIVDEAQAVTGAEHAALFHRLRPALSARDGWSSVVASEHPEVFAARRSRGRSALQLATLRDRQRVRLADVTKETRHGRILSVGGVPLLRSYLATPVVSRTGDVLGGLFLGHAERGVFTPLHEELAGAIAAQAGIAIDNAVHFESVRRHAESLAEEGRRKSRVLATLGHELRNPLGALTTSLATMEEANLMHPDVRRAIGIMWRQCRHMRRLVDDLMDMSRLARGAIELHMEPISLQDVVDNACADAEFFTSARHQRIVTRRPRPVVFVHGDPIRLEQVVANLLNNASRHSPERARIEIDVVATEDRARVHVRDHGRGIDPAHLEEIFDLFVQSEDSASESRGGLGLGLTLVRELVHLHDGTVHAFSRGLGQGSEFVVELPRIRAPYLVGEAPLEPEEDASSKPLRRGHRVLVVEDQEDAREALQILLRRWGFAVDVAADARQAISRATQAEPEVVLMDIGLPHMSGWELVKHLRRRLPERVQIIALTGLGQSIDRVRSERAGFDDHLVKPVDPVVLRARLEDAVEALSVP